MNPRKLPFSALALLAAVACGSSSATTSATSSNLVDTCSGEYHCNGGAAPGVSGVLDLELQPGASGCAVLTGGGTAPAGFLVTPQGQLILTADGTPIGTWTLEAKGDVSFCFDSYCALCVPKTLQPVTSNPKACSGAYDCPDVPSYYLASGYTLGMKAGVCVAEFLAFTPDGKLTDSLSGRQQGTWSGDANTFQSCNNAGKCSTCILYPPTPDAGSGPTPQCTGNSDCGGCSRCASGTCVSCPIGTQGVCTC